MFSSVFILSLSEGTPSLVQQNASKFQQPTSASALRNGLGRHSKAAAGGFSLQKFLSDRITLEVSGLFVMKFDIRHCMDYEELLK